MVKQNSCFDILPGICFPPSTELFGSFSCDSCRWVVDIILDGERYTIGYCELADCIIIGRHDNGIRNFSHSNMNWNDPIWSLAAAVLVLDRPALLPLLMRVLHD